MYVAYLCPDNYATGRKAKVFAAVTIIDAVDGLVALKKGDGAELLQWDLDEPNDAVDLAFAKAGQIQLFTIEKE